MKRLRIRKSGPLKGVVRVPGDLHIGQQALLWAALSEGPCLVSGLSTRPDHAQLVQALRSMGVPIAHTPQGYRIAGVGLRGLKMPSGALSAGESISTLELLTPLLCAQHFGTRIEARGDALNWSLRTLIGPLRARGAHVAGKATEDGDQRAPVSVAPLLPDELLSEAEIEIPDGDAATKLALLITGLHTRGITAISEGMLSRDHAERALTALGLPIETLGGMTLLDTSDEQPRWAGFEWDIPGDITLASFVMAAALSLPGSDVQLEHVGVNRSRTGWFDAMRHAGADIELTPKGDVAGGEPVADIRVQSSRLRGLRVGGELSFRVIDELFALVALAPAMAARMSVRDISHLRLRTPDPLKALAQLLRSFGGECTDYEDGFDLDAASQLRGIELPAGTAPELILSACVLGLSAENETVVHDASPVFALYPEFVDTLASLGARIEQEEVP